MSSPDTPVVRMDDHLISLIWWKPATDIAEQTRRRCTLYLVPFLFFLYILAYVDRSNVSVAKLQLTQPVAQGGLAFDDKIIGFGAGIFFWGYWILEVPSTRSVLTLGARWVFVRILVLWGLSCAVIGFIGLPVMKSAFGWLPDIPPDLAFFVAIDNVLHFVFGGLTQFILSADCRPLSGFAYFLNNLDTSPEYQFYFFRFMLGFFEGGFFPSVILYLSIWFRPQDRGRAIATFMAAIPTSNIIAAGVCSLLLNVNWLGLAGWRWIFILTGIIPVLTGFITLFMLPDRPNKADWLKPDEREWLIAELERDQAGKHHHDWKAIWASLAMVLLLTTVYFCQNVTSYGLSFFLPTILQKQLGTSNFVSGLLSGLPYVMALIGMLINGWHSDKTRERIWHVAIPYCFLSAGLVLAATIGNYAALPALVMIFFVGPFMYAHLPAFWPIPTMFLGAATAAAAIGFINMIGNLGGSVGPWLVGTSKDDYSVGLLRLAPWPIVAAIIVVAVGQMRKSSTTK